MAATLLWRLRERGLDIQADDGELVVRSRAPLTAEQRGYIREHKRQLIAELTRSPKLDLRAIPHVRCRDCQHFRSGAPGRPGLCSCFGWEARPAGDTQCTAFAPPGAPARPLPPTPAQLAAARGTAVRCSDCIHLQPRPGERPDGYCARYATETWSAAEFECAGFAPSGLQLRRMKVEQQLRDSPALKLAADVENAPLTPEAGDEPVSIVLAVRIPSGIVSGELVAPRERFDTAVFFTYLHKIGQAS